MNRESNLLTVQQDENLFSFFYIRGSMHRNSRFKKSNDMEQYADIYLPLNDCTCFRLPSRPSSGVHKTVVAVSGTDHSIWGASFFKQPRPSAWLLNR